jgi:hypothetical protein
VALGKILSTSCLPRWVLHPALVLHTILLLRHCLASSSSSSYSSRPTHGSMMRTALPRSSLSRLAASHATCTCTRALVPAARSFCAAATSSAKTSRTPATLRRRFPSSSGLASVRTFTNTSRMAANTRTESDAFGEIQVPSDKYWGAQTERSLENFKINQPQDRMPPPIVRAFGILKGAAATVNMKFGLGKYGARRAAGLREWCTNMKPDVQTPRSGRPSSKPPLKWPR